MRIMRWIPVAAALGLGLLTSACGAGDGGNGPGGGGGGGVSGDYTLGWVNEDGLPEDEPMEWGTAGFRGGALRLTGDGSWEMRIDYENVESGEALTLTDNGDYDRDGSDLTFSSDVWGDEFEGEVNGNEVSLTYDFDGNGSYETVFTFEK